MVLVDSEYLELVGQRRRYVVFHGGGISRGLGSDFSFFDTEGVDEEIRGKDFHCEGSGWCRQSDTQ